MLKPKAFKGKDLKGEWVVSYKYDGVRCLINKGQALSRNNKPLYNLDGHPDGDYEVFLGTLEDSVSAVRTIQGRHIPADKLYSIDPIDDRLYISTETNPTAEWILGLMNRVVADGHEGLVLRQGDKLFKVKPKETYDVVIRAIEEGKGRNQGKLGAFVTDRGNVGSGLSDIQRSTFFDTDLIGTTIEVECMKLTPAGMFRHPVYIRMRFDKDADKDADSNE